MPLHEAVLNLIEQLRAEARGGLTVTEDFMQYLSFLASAGWAKIRPEMVIENGVILQFTVLIQTPQMKEWAKRLKGSEKSCKQTILSILQHLIYIPGWALIGKCTETKLDCFFVAFSM